MEFFLSAEVQASAAAMLMQLNRLASEALQILSGNYYGDALDNIAIITILVNDNLLLDGGYKERIVFQRKTHSADIRLRIDYKSFMRATPAKRYEMFVNHILKSIACLAERVDYSFQMNKLLLDMKEALSQSSFKQSCLNIRHFPD